MADSILRLKVESQEYDAKLKRATEGLQRYVDGCRKVGGTLEVVEKETLDYVRSLGQMETNSRNATGRLAEMKKAFTDFSVMYKNLTEEERKGDFGKGLAESLDQLKVRIDTSKQQLEDVNKELNGGGGLKDVLDAVAGKFGLSIDQITKFGGVVGIATTAVKVAKDAFFQSESGIDEWGRTAEGAKGAYSAFLDTLNNGNWSNFFQNLSAAIQGGRDLYDVFDRLGSIKSNNAAAIALTQKEIAELRLAKQQGENVDAKLKAATERLAALQKQSVSAGMNAGSQSAFQTIRNGVNSIGGAGVNDATIKYAVDRIMNGGQGEFDRYKRNYEILQQKGMVTRTQTINDSQGGTYERQYKVFDINTLTTEQQKQYALAKAITEGETRIQKGIAAYAQAVSEGTASAREEFKGNRYALQGSSDGGGGGNKNNDLDPLQQVQKQIADLSKEALTADDARLDEITKQVAVLQEQEKSYKQIQDRVRGIYDINAEIEKQFPQLDVSGQQSGPQRSFMDQARQDYAVQLSDKNMLVDETTLHSLMSTAIQNGIDNLDPDFTTLKEKMAEGMDIPDETWQGLQDTINAKLKELGIEPIKLDFKTGEVKTQAADMVKSWQAAGSAIQSVGQAMSAIEDPAAKVVGTVAQAVATMALSYAEASVNAAKNPAMAGWGWIAFAATGLATMLTSISAIKNASHYAKGGIVPGNDYSDNTPVLVSSGELILNRSQQNTLATELTRQDGQGGGVSGTPYVNGEQIFLGLNNYLRRTGRGELVTAH